jgi:hypothetical protein
MTAYGSSMIFLAGGCSYKIISSLKILLGLKGDSSETVFDLF